MWLSSSLCLVSWWQDWLAELQMFVLCCCVEIPFQISWPFETNSPSIRADWRRQASVEEEAIWREPVDRLCWQSTFVFARLSPPRIGSMLRPEEIYRHHKQRVFRLCLRFCGGNIALAEDITQDVFLKVLERFEELNDIEALEPWLYRVTTNACFSRFRRDHSVWERVRRVLSLAPQAHWQTPEHQVVVREGLQQTLACLADLPAKERVVFCMHYLDEMPQRDIVETLGLSKGYVSKLLQRAQLRIQASGWSLTDA